MDNHIANMVGGPEIAELRAIDIRCSRPLRAIQVAQAAGQEPDPRDIQALTDLEEQAAQLRSRLAG